ncbi:hypothetical protein BKA62DRAFT_777191 [Auriculariales sp. MPI-PUGE-AT-0066]|nr:hypothetical protein BKA62DRAFT_777191 [Auriculariales sp. MPI-PUGE-AT-0066]
MAPVTRAQARIDAAHAQSTTNPPYATDIDHDPGDDTDAYARSETLTVTAYSATLSPRPSLKYMKEDTPAWSIPTNQFRYTTPPNQTGSRSRTLSVPTAPGPVLGSPIVLRGSSADEEDRGPIDEPRGHSRTFFSYRFNTTMRSTLPVRYGYDGIFDPEIPSTYKAMIGAPLVRSHSAPNIGFAARQPRPPTTGSHCARGRMLASPKAWDSSEHNLVT